MGTSEARVGAQPRYQGWVARPDGKKGKFKGKCATYGKGCFFCAYLKGWQIPLDRKINTLRKSVNFLKIV